MGTSPVQAEQSSAAHSRPNPCRRRITIFFRTLGCAQSRMASFDQSRELRIIPISLADEIRPGDALPEKLIQALKHQNLSLRKGDILIVKHKIVSKAEGRLVELDSIKPSPSSRAWARRYHLDARVTEVALAESKRVVRRKRGVMITETQHGLICANRGVDVSNVNGGRHALLLPKDADRSAAQLHRELKK